MSARTAVVRRRARFDVWVVDDAGREVERLVPGCGKARALALAKAVADGAKVRLVVRDCAGKDVAAFGEGTGGMISPTVVAEGAQLLAALHRGVAATHAAGASAPVQEGTFAKAIRERVAASPAAREFADSVIKQIGERVEKILTGR